MEANHSILQHTHMTNFACIHIVKIYLHIYTKCCWETTETERLLSSAKPKLRYGSHSGGTNIALSRHLATFFRHRTSCGIAPQASVLRAIMKGAFWMDVNHHLEAAKRIVHAIKIKSNKKKSKHWDMLSWLAHKVIHSPLGSLYNIIYIIL